MHMAPKDKYIKKTNAQIVAGITRNSSVSSTLNAGRAVLEQPEQKSKKVQPKIMKKAEAVLPTIVELRDPSLEEVREAQKQAGVKRATRSTKDDRRMSRVSRKRSMQESLAEKKDNLFFNLGEGEINEQIESFKAMDVSELLYSDSGKSPDENLLEHYVELQATFSCIDTYEQQLNEKITNGIPEEEAEKFAQEMAQFNTLKDVRSFYQIHEALMANKYYAILPRDHMLSMSYRELRTRLDELYAKKDDERDISLIDFYQNLIRLKQLDITDAASVKARKEHYLSELTHGEKEDDRDGAKEMKKISAGYEAFLKELNKKQDFYTENERKEYIAQFMDAHRGDIEKFRANADISDTSATKLLSDFDQYVNGLNANAAVVEEKENASGIVNDTMEVKKGKLDKRSEPPAGIVISPEQVKAMKRVGAYLLRRSCLESRKYSAFVHHFLQSPPEQQLTAFYLLENKKQDAAMNSDFYEAISDYMPDLSVIKKNLKTKLFSSAPDWKKVTNAIQVAKGLGGEMAEFAGFQDKIRELDRTVEDGKRENADAKEQGGRILENIAYRYGMLELLYRNAGLNPDMSPDMVPDAKLRARMYREFATIGKLAGELEQLTGKLKDFEEVQADKSVKGEADTYKEKEDKPKSQSVNEWGGKINNVLSYPNTANRALGLWYKEKESGWGKTFLGYSAVGYITNSLGAVSGLIGAYSSIYGGIKLFGKEGLTGVDRYAQWLGAGSGTVGSLSGTATGIQHFLRVAQLVDSNKEAFTDAVTAFSGIGLLTSSVSTLVSGIQLGRAVSSGNDIQRARAKMPNKAENALSMDEKKLLRFFSHSEKEIGRQKSSKTVGLIKGFAGMFVAASAFIPVLTPIAAGVTLLSFVGGAIYDHCDKNKRKGVIKQAVDDQLGLDNIVAKLKERHPNKKKLAAMDPEKLKDMARDEAVARFGYSSYKSYFVEVCREFADLLYRKMFDEKEITADGREMYAHAILSLGLKVTLPDKAKGIKAAPSQAAIVAKLMGG